MAIRFAEVNNHQSFFYEFVHLFRVAMAMLLMAVLAGMNWQSTLVLPQDQDPVQHPIVTINSLIKWK